MAFSVGSVVQLDGVESVIIYDAGSEQSWGRYLVVDRNHDLCYYFLGSDFVNDSDWENNKWGYEWGGYGIETSVTNKSIGAGFTNTNTLIGLNLKSYNNDWEIVWDKIKEFRTHIGSTKWFLPSVEELNLIYTNKNSLSNLSLTTNYSYYSSYEYNIYGTWRQFFNDGSSTYTYKNDRFNRSRLCRYATDSDFITKSINISCTTSNATIHYTTDGTDPELSSPVYSSVLSVPGGTLVKARGFKDGLLASDVATYQVDYSVVLTVGTGGTASVNDTFYPAGSTVTVTISPTGSYELGAITITAGSGEKVSFTSTTTGITFTMPSSNVSIEIEFTEPAPCLDADALVTLADGTEKKFRDLDINDRVMVWNFDEGKIDFASLLWYYEPHKADWYWFLKTETGKEMKVIKNHRFFSPDLGRFERATNLIGCRVWVNNIFETVTSCDRIDEPVEFCNAISYYHMNVIVNGFLTSCGFNNIYPIKDMKWEAQTKRSRGTSSDYWDQKGIPQKWYDGMRIDEQYSPDEEIVKYVKDRL